MAGRRTDEFSRMLRSQRRGYVANDVVEQFSRVNRKRVEALSATLATYIRNNLPAAFENRDGLADYRSNPYVLMTSAQVMKLTEPQQFAQFLFNTKMYSGLETSFGKAIEAAFVGHYPINTEEKWTDPSEKLAEAAQLTGLGREDKARRRTGSVWREIDKSVVVGRRRYMTSIKSGPNCINDTQVQAMTQAIVDHHAQWLNDTQRSCPGVDRLDIVLGLTYGTDRTTNNKENQILVKLLDHGFEEENREATPGVLIDGATRSVRVCRRIGSEFWAFVGRPDNPATASFVFLEILLALARALSTGIQAAELETRINQKIADLADALLNLRLPRRSLPQWIREQFSEPQLFWFATAISAFYDEGI